MWRTADPHTGVQIPPRPFYNHVDLGECVIIRNYYEERKSGIFIFIFKLLFILLFLLLISLSASASNCVINEVMINPIDSEAYYEWIELYNPTDENINISDWKLKDNSATDTLLPANESTTLIIPPNGFVIITDQDSLLTIPHSDHYTISHFMVDDNSICNGLGNTDDYLLLLNQHDNIIDAVEWGKDTSEVSGNPIQSPIEGSTIIRTEYSSTINSSAYFSETTVPTMGAENILRKIGTINIDFLQQYIPKISRFDLYSTPFSLKCSLQNFTPFSSYQFKSYITGNTSNQYPASQTWTGEKWQYSDRYTHTIITDETGCWTGWISLRLSKEYAAYTSQIQNNQSGIIHIKIKDESTIVETQQNVILLDVDNSTTHGKKGGFFIGTDVCDQLLCLIDESGEIISCYYSEPNEIDDFNPEINGYYKLSGPIEKKYTLNQLDSSGSYVVLQNNLTLQYGCYHFEVNASESSFDRKDWLQFSTKITIQNNGNLKDTYHVLIDDYSEGFHARIETKEITLKPTEERQIPIYIDPYYYHLMTHYDGTINLTILSKNDPVLQKTLILSCSIHQPDLTIPKIKTYTEEGIESTSFNEGNIIRVKAFVKNQGDETASDVTVSYFLDSIKRESLLETITYDSIAQYQKYPSLYWDTHLIEPGEHTIFVVTDYKDTVEELNENNNQNNITITLTNTTPTNTEKQLLITGFYYYAHPTINNEFITLYNPTNKPITLDGWYITNTISKRITEQKKIIFPKGSILPARSKITITENSNDYFKEQLTQPDYEYGINANQLIPQLTTTSTVHFSNTGGGIALKDKYNHTIDSIFYGNTSIDQSCWKGSPIPRVKQGEILFRCIQNNTYLDTHTALDWDHPYFHHIGQTIFNPKEYTLNTTIIPFVSPDTSFSVFSSYFKKAKSEILLNVYEFTSTELANLLLNALHRNVTINIIAEGCPIGGISEKQQFLFNRLHHHGAHINYLIGNPLNHVFKRYRFTHAKYAIIDQELIIIHSGNFAPTGIPSDTSFGNREWGVLINNDSIAHFYSTVFYADWNPDQADTIPFSPVNISDDRTYFVSKDPPFGYYKPTYNLTKEFSDTFTIQPVLSPDNSLSAISNLLLKANQSIYIQQLYLYPNWGEQQNPLIPLLIDQAKQGADVRIILNYNPWYDSTNIQNNETKTLLEQHNINVKYIYTNWSIFQNVHNKAVIVDNKSVLISSINWNENSFTNNREVGVIITHPDIAHYYAQVFLSDWNLSDPSVKSENILTNLNEEQLFELNTHTIYIGALFTMTFIVVARDWRKRSWP